MLERVENIFFNIVKNETSLTEVFCNLMMYKSFRIHFIDFVKSKQNSFDVDTNKIKYSSFITEKDFGKEFDNNNSDEDKSIGRGDLILTIDDRDYIFELKIEIYTQLTKNQPNGYIKYLQSKNQTKDDLFFILPKSYKHINCLSNIDKNNILFWEDFIQSIKTEGLDDILYIKDFINIMNYRWFYSEEFSFSKYEKNIISNKRKVDMNDNTIPKIMMDLTNKVDEITKRVIKNKLSYNDWKDDSGYGVFIKNDEKDEILWFGIDYKFWNEYGIPLSIGVDGMDEKYVELLYKSFENEIVKVKFEEDAYFYYIPLPFEIYDTTDQIILKISEVKEKLGLN